MKINEEAREKLLETVNGLTDQELIPCFPSPSASALIIRAIKSISASRYLTLGIYLPSTQTYEGK